VSNRADSRDLVAIVCGDRVRVERDAAGRFRLPSLPDTDGWANPADLVTLAADPSAVIAAPATRLLAEPKTTLHLLVIDRAGPQDNWLPLRDLSELAEPDGVATAILSGLDRHRRADLPDGRPEWFAEGWRASADAWTDDQLSNLELRRAGPSVMIKLWGLSAVLRIPVAGRDNLRRDVYFKATCPLFHAEPAITELLANVIPDHLPDLLAVDRGRAFMLMGALPGADPDAGRRPDVAPAASRVMARIQMIMIGHLAELRAAGAPDRTLDPTLEGLAMIISDSLELDQLTAEERDLIRRAEPWLAEQLQGLAACGLPYTISHGDLHVGNIAEGGDRLVIYDWTDAAISFPTLDAVLLARSATDAHRDETMAGYVEEWRRGFDSLEYEAIWQTSLIATKVYQAISYERIYRAQEPRTRWELGGVVAQLLRDLGSRWSDQSGR